MQFNIEGVNVLKVLRVILRPCNPNLLYIFFQSLINKFYKKYDLTKMVELDEGKFIQPPFLWY